MRIPIEDSVFKVRVRVNQCLHSEMGLSPAMTMSSFRDGFIPSNDNVFIQRWVYPHRRQCLHSEIGWGTKSDCVISEAKFG